VDLEDRNRKTSTSVLIYSLFFSVKLYIIVRFFSPQVSARVDKFYI
jgi:hypothetical protein